MASVSTNLSALPAPPAAARVYTVDEYSRAMNELNDFYRHAPERMPTGEKITRHELPTGECVSCIRWKDKFFITSTDIIRGLVFRFQAIGRPVTQSRLKKFEEGVFSDLRNLKSGIDATLEEPRSDFLEMLYKHQCIRTQKKQRVFHWFAVRHDYLFGEALERDYKREARGAIPTTNYHGGGPDLRCDGGGLSAMDRHPTVPSASLACDPLTPTVHVSLSQADQPFKPLLDHFHHIGPNGVASRLPRDAPTHSGHDEDDNDIFNELQAVNSEMNLAESATPSAPTFAGAGLPCPPLIHESSALGHTDFNLLTSPVPGASAPPYHQRTLGTDSQLQCLVHQHLLTQGCTFCSMALHLNQSRDVHPPDPTTLRSPTFPLTRIGAPYVVPPSLPKRKTAPAGIDLVATSTTKRIARHTCPKCQRDFQRAESLRRHMSTHDTTPKTFRCTVSGCLSDFAELESLNRHLQLNHAPTTPGRSILPSQRAPPPPPLNLTNAMPPSSCVVPSAPTPVSRPSAHPPRRPDHPMDRHLIGPPYVITGNDPIYLYPSPSVHITGLPNAPLSAIMSPSDAAQYASLLSPPMGLYHNSGLSPTAHQGMSSLSLNHGIGYPFGSVPPSPATTVPPESLATFMHHHSPYGPGSVNGLHQTEFPQRGVDNWDQLPDLIADVDDDDTPNLEELPTLQFTQIPTGKQSKSTGL